MNIMHYGRANGPIPKHRDVVLHVYSVIHHVIYTPFVHYLHLIDTYVTGRDVVGGLPLLEVQASHVVYLYYFVRTYL
jgi:hypothetical protein